MLRKTVALLVGLCLGAPAWAQPPPGQYAASGSEAYRPAFSVALPINRAGSPPLSPRALAELGAVALTGAGHLAFSAADASVVYIPLVALGGGGTSSTGRGRTPRSCGAWA